MTITKKAPEAKVFDTFDEAFDVICEYAALSEFHYADVSVYRPGGYYVVDTFLIDDDGFMTWQGFIKK